MAPRRVKDGFLRLLVKHCRRSVPLTKKMYGDAGDLKSKLDQRKWNFISNRAQRVKVLDPAAYYKLLPWFQAWIDRSGTGIPKKRGYDASAHTSVHEDFKDDCAKLFVQRVRAASSPGGERGNVFVLDDLSKTRKVLRTVSLLRGAGIGAKRIHLANPSEAICKVAKRHEVPFAQDVLENAVGEQGIWSEVRSAAAYLDTCSGSSSYIQKLLEAVLKNGEERYELAYTIVGRSPERRSEVEDSSIVSRINRIDRMLRSRGFQKIGACDEDSVRVFSGGMGVVTCFYYRA